MEFRAPEQRGGVLRIERQGRIEVRERLVRVAQRGVSIAPLRQRLGILGQQLDRLLYTLLRGEGLERGVDFPKIALVRRLATVLQQPLGERRF